MEKAGPTPAQGRRLAEPTARRCRKVRRCCCACRATGRARIPAWGFDRGFAVVPCAHISTQWQLKPETRKASKGFLVEARAQLPQVSYNVWDRLVHLLRGAPTLPLCEQQVGRNATRSQTKPRPGTLLQLVGWKFSRMMSCPLFFPLNRRGAAVSEALAHRSLCRLLRTQLSVDVM